MPVTKPRRTPRRRSSAEVVDAILTAASELLVHEGIDGLTTNHVASRAGVSVGSVYRYFPNKQAIVAGVTGRLNLQIVDAIKAALEVEATPRERLLAASIAYVRFGQIPLRRAILGDVPRGWDESGIRAGESAVRSMIDALASSFTSLSEAEAREHIIAAVFAIRGAVQGALLMEPSMLAGDAIASRAADLVRLWLPEE